jgi:hypothetical protein
VIKSFLILRLPPHGDGRGGDNPGRLRPDRGWSQEGGGKQDCGKKRAKHWT